MPLTPRMHEVSPFEKWVRQFVAQLRRRRCIPLTVYSSLQAVRRLSCMARDNGIYLVANLIEKVDMGGELLLHNTNVAFDSNGTVVAR
jgi:hypothetical protein